MFCPYCGKEIKDDAAFCPECGAALKNQTAPADTAYTQPDANSAPKPNQGYVYTPPAPNAQFNGGPYNGAQPERKSTRTKLAAGLLGIFLGSFGIHNFYLGKTSRGIVQIIVTVVTCGIGGIWGFIEGIMCLCGSVTDVDGLPLSD